ncbi:hypothetical protein ACWDSL_41005 [Streptomyces sp. NPDC000941]
MTVLRCLFVSLVLYGVGCMILRAVEDAPRIAAAIRAHRVRRHAGGRR